MECNVFLIQNYFFRWFLIVAVGTAILSFTMFSTWMISGERQGIEYRKKYF